MVPQLIPFDVNEQRLYSELLPNRLAPHPISKGVTGHPAEEAHFNNLYPGSHSFGHDQRFMPISKGRNVDGLVNRELRFLAQLILHHNGPTQRPHCCSGCTDPSSISHSILPSLMNKTPRCLNSST
ncbi:hypothetical protein CHARACLAT_022045 [Characodon lateralis]|uniref:Uncharacterized protein n=1 Tax=Characodon lateralis TaxID=208331 RepID=A0ABU7DUZ6_9TELE|nr:hypothetical protein [Characodon lateralis]